MKRCQVQAEDVLIWGLMAIAFFIMFAKLNHIIEYTFIGLLIFWVSVKAKNREFNLVRTPLDLPIILFLSWVFITIPFSVDPSYSFAEWRKTIIQILMFYFVVNVVNNEMQVRKVLQAFLAGIVFLSMVGVIEHVVSRQSLWDKNSHASSLTSAAQWLSTYIVMGIPFVWFFFVNAIALLTKCF